MAAFSAGLGCYPIKTHFEGPTKVYSGRGSRHCYAIKSISDRYLNASIHEAASAVRPVSEQAQNKKAPQAGIDSDKRGGLFLFSV
jgi:hypothetical protein